MKRLLGGFQEADATGLRGADVVAQQMETTYIGSRFEDAFPGLSRSNTWYVTGELFHFPSWEEYWASCRFVTLNHWSTRGQSYVELLEMLKQTISYHSTTNADTLLGSRIWQQKVYHIQGEYGLFQCEIALSSKNVSRWCIVRKIVEQKIWRYHELIPFGPEMRAMLVPQAQRWKGMVESADFFEPRTDEFLEET